MRYLYLIMFLLMFAAPAFAGDILRLPEFGQYRFHARVAADELPYDPADLTGTAEICAFDVEIELVCFPVDAVGEVNELITLANDGVDKRIRGRSRDASGNTSVDSVDAYLIDLTPPGSPELVAQ